MNFEIVSWKPLGQPGVNFQTKNHETAGRVIFGLKIHSCQSGFPETISKFMSCCDLSGLHHDNFSEFSILKIHSLGVNLWVLEWIYGLFLKIHSKEWIYGLFLKIHSEEWIYGLFLKIHSEEWIYGFKNHCCNKTSSGQWVYWQFLPVIFLLVSGVIVNTSLVNELCMRELVQKSWGREWNWNQSSWDRRWCDVWF